jgi:uncharacterized protein YceK
MKNKSLLLFLILMAILSGCATVIKGTKQKVIIDSDPSGAKVYVNGTEKGTTPLEMKLKRGLEVPVIVVSKENYSSEKIVPETVLEKTALLNMLVVPQWGIDLISGAMWKYELDKYYVSLKPAKQK